MPKGRPTGRPFFFMRSRSIPLVVRHTPYGSVDVLHDGADLTVWRVRKDGEEMDPALSVCDRDDVLCVIEGSLRLELEGLEPIVLRSGDVFVIPAGTPFRSYRWPRDGGLCEFVAATPADATFS